MIIRRISTHRSQLGTLLVKGAHISQKQLDMALNYQAEKKIKLGAALLELNLISPQRLKFVLKRQSWIRATAALFAFALSPFNSAIATENQHIEEKTLKTSPRQQLPTQENYPANVYFSAIDLDPASKEFYYSGKNTGNLSFSKKISEKTGINLNILSPHISDDGIDVSYQFDPQISLFNISTSPKKINYSGKPFVKRYDRGSNTKPAVFMLTLKGRSLFENSGNGIKMWSLDRAKVGVQRKAVLMFSITKQF